MTKKEQYTHLMEKYEELKKQREILELEPKKNKDKIDSLRYDIIQIALDIRSLTYNFTDLVAEEELED